VPRISEYEWVRRFTTELIRHKSLDLETLDEIARSRYLEGFDMEPEDAALLYAAKLPPGARPGDR
jgi:hypothetical protein